MIRGVHILHRFIREPLVHFVIAGALIFADYAAVVDTKTTDGTDTIRVGVIGQTGWVLDPRPSRDVERSR